MSGRVICPGCGAPIRISLDMPGKPIRCSKCRTAFPIPDRRVAGEPENPPPPEAPARGVTLGILVLAVAAALFFGVALAGGIAVLYWRHTGDREVADMPRANFDAGEPANRGAPAPLLHTDDLAPPRGPSESKPQKQADSQPLHAGDRPRPPGPQVEATLKTMTLADWEPGLALPNLSGWAMLPDGATLVVALPDEATLAYIDTVGNRESRRVKLPFKPECLAVQGKHLFASAQGASAVHVLDADSGANKKEIKVPDGFVTAMACHPQKGPVYLVMSEQHSVHTLDPEKGATALAGFNGLVPIKFPAPHFMAIRARAQYLAVDPHNANTFYTSYASGIDKWHEGIRERTYGQGVEKFAVRGNVARYPGDLPGQRTTISVPAGAYQPLERIGVNTSAVPVTSDPGGFYPVRVSHDGKRVGVISRGEIQMLAAANIKMGDGAARCSSPSDLAFHPVLDLMAVEVTNGSEKALSLFDEKSLTQITRIFLHSVPFANPPPTGRLLTFGAHGTRLLYYDRMGGGLLRSFPLALGGADLAALTKAYGTEVRGFKAPAAIEGENAKILGKSSDFRISAQDMTPFLVGQWSGNRQLFAEPASAGAWADLEIPAPAEGKYDVVVYLTRSWDYGTIQFHLNGARIGAPLDGFHANTVISTGAIDLGEAELKKGANTLRVEVVATNPKSAAPHYSWGLDCVELRPAR